MTAETTCRECGKLISAESPGGFCAQCLLRLGLEVSTEGQEPKLVQQKPSEGGAEPWSQAEDLKSTLILPVLLTEKAGDRIGRYRLLQEIGQGGCGVVYMAEQEEPVHRRVALKVIKLGMDTKQVVARFEAERQALALMDHPNIAKVLDAGATDAGRPYFVMELVRGIRITDYCDQNKLPTSERLKLFTQVCQAIQHAHQKGIIHRDIKPSNILVTLHDGAPVPKVIDFGIAKATQGRLTDQTLFTAFEQFIGTPAYMSPEQVEMSGLDIDTRSDIYSLGVLLYELLVGKTPFSGEELLAEGIDKMRYVIREKDPVRPSTRLATMMELDLTTTAKHRQTNAPRLIHLVRGDLDWIVMKCLEKDRTRRYETANGLALDIQRHLQEQPILARPPGAVYQLEKFLRRNKVMVTAAVVITTALVLGIFELVQNRQTLSISVIATVLVLGILVSTREAIRAKRAEREQEQSRHQAETAQQNEARQREFAQAQEFNARRRAYASDMIAAWQSFLDGDVSRTRELLERQRPASGQIDLRGFEWRYLWAQSRPNELFILPTNYSSAARHSPDGRLLAVAGGTDGIVSVWEADSQRRLKSIQASPTDVAGLAFSPDGKTLATASRFADKEKVKLWDVESGRLQAVLLPDNRQEAGCVSFSPDGQRLITIASTAYTKGIPSEVRVWDVASRRQLFELAVDGSFSRSCSLSPDGQMLAIGDGDGLVRVWDLKIQKEIRSLMGHHGFVGVVSFSPTGLHLASADEHGVIIIWDWSTGNVSSVFSAHRAPIYDLAFSRDGKRLATASRDHTAKLLDLSTGTELATFRGHPDRVTSVEFSPDQQRLVTAGINNVRAWHATPKADTILFSPEKSTGTVRFSPDGRLLVQELWKSNQLVLWDAASRSRLQPSLMGRDCAFSADGKFLLFICDGRPVVYDPKTLLLRETIHVEAPVSGPIAISPDGRFLAARRGTREVLFNLELMREIATVEGTSEDAAPVVFSHDSRKLIVVGPHAGTLQVWDVDSWQLSAQLKGHTAWLEALTLSQDGKVLASGAYDRTVRFWDTVTWEPGPEPILQSNAGAVTRLAFSPDGITLAIGTFDGAVKLWNHRAQEEVGAVNGHASIVRGLAFSPDGRMLASSSYDGTWRVWDAPALADIEE
jgi:WD40 repeat protein/serine/threonine protein kinase